MATNRDDQRHNLVKFIQRGREFGDFLKVHVFIFVAVMVYLVAVLVCGCPGIGP